MVARGDIASGIFLGVFFSLFFALMAVEAAKDLARAMEETECCMRCPDCPPDSGAHGAGSISGEPSGHIALSVRHGQHEKSEAQQSTNRVTSSPTNSLGQSDAKRCQVSLYSVGEPSDSPVE